MAEIKKNFERPVITYNVPYQITAACFKSSDEEAQTLAVGLIDGAIVVFDLQLGIEKYFVEKHPATITALEFFEDKVLVSGSVDGRVNLCDLESEKQEKVYKC